MLVTKLNSNGTLFIPVQMRKDLGLENGEPVVITVEDGVAKIMSHRQAVEALRDSLGLRGMNLSEELSQERQAAALHE